MRKRPLLLLLSSCLFLYFPMECYFRWHHGESVELFDVLLSVVLPLFLLVGLIRVTTIGWYTLVTMVSMWGIRDLYHYYSAQGSSLSPLLIHIGIYCVSLGYFINPRIRTLCFDPKLRWWRTKPRYETHIPFLMHTGTEWQYPILRNISEGGCFIESSHPPEVNSAVKIAIPLPVPLSVSVIQAEGEIRWVSRGADRSGMGVQFTHCDPQDAKAIREYVRRQL